MGKREELEKLRNQIDEIDEKILSLLNKRAELVIKVGEIKKVSNLPISDPARERKILKKILEKNKGPLKEKHVRGIFQEIFSASLDIQRPLTIAYLGPEATFTHEAARKRFGWGAEYIPLPSIEEVFREVEREKAVYGVVPVENSTEGVETHTLDMFIESELRVCDEIILRIIHHFLSFSPLSSIKRVYSHPQALAQCRGWLKKNLPQAEVIEVYSTASAVEKAKEDKEGGAIASELASEVYGVPIQASGIEDKAFNLTRFLVLGKEEWEKTGKDKTSIMFALKDEVGALFHALAPFWEFKVNLCKIESRPSKRRPWEYYFFVDLEGHKEDENVKKALEKLKERTTLLKILGSYPRREEE